MIEETLMAIAGAVTKVILPKAFEAVGKRVGDAAFDKSGEVIQETRKIVQEKLAIAGTSNLLKRAEEKPTDVNQQVLQAELVSQMEEDEEFFDKLQELLRQIASIDPELQSILDNALIRGELEIDDIEIKNVGQPYGKQVIARNLKVGKNAKFGKISIENRDE